MTRFTATAYCAGIVLLSGCGTTESPDNLKTALPSNALPETSAETTAYAGTPHVIPGVIETEHYDRGAPEVAYHDNDEENLGVDYRDSTQVDIEKRPDASNGHGIGWTRKGEWLNYTVTIEQAGAYNIEFPVASNKQGGIFHLEIDGADITGPIEVPDTGGWKVLKTISAQTTPLKKGQFVIKMVMDEQGESGSIGDIDLMRFVRQGAALEE